MRVAAEVKQTEWFRISLALATIVYAALYCVFVYTTLVRVPVWDLLDWVFSISDRADRRLVELSLATDRRAPDSNIAPAACG